MQVEEFKTGKCSTFNLAKRLLDKELKKMAARKIDVIDYGVQMIQEIVERPDGYVDFLGQERPAATFSENLYQGWFTYWEEAEED